MEYTRENMTKTITKIKKNENLSWQQMADLFGFKNKNTVNQYATGTKALSADSFVKHFGAIEQYWPEEKTEKPEKVQIGRVVEDKPVEKKAPVVKEEGIVLNCQTVAELVKLLDIVGYRMEVIRSK